MKFKREYVPPAPSDTPPGMVKRVCCKNCVYRFETNGLCTITGKKLKPMKLHQCPRFKSRKKK